jgi:competence protein ComFB
MFTEIHNTIEDLVFSQVEEICDTIERESKGQVCTCRQCRVDTACYVLNRMAPHYISSNRGVARVGQETIARQQKEADIATLVYEGIRRVNHNQRPFIVHGTKNVSPEEVAANPVFNIPTIIGRLFNGVNFEPLSGITVELRRNGDLVAMKDPTWRNPYSVVPNTEGTFTFWPTSIPAEANGLRKVFEYSVKIEAPEFETLTHFFTIPVISEIQTAGAGAYSMDKTFKIPDLYMFPPGGEEDEDLAL